MNETATVQWANFLKNLGEWRGSFTLFSPNGRVLRDTPSLLTLTGRDNNSKVRLALQFFSPDTGEPDGERVLEYDSIGTSILFFESGAFSQGSLQWSPVSQFGGEFGFVAGDRRSRLIQLFQQGQLDQVTLIREQRAGTHASERSPLVVEDLIGDWQGEAVSLYPDWRDPARYSTRLVVEREGDRLHQQLQWGETVFDSTAQIQGASLVFSERGMPIQILLLPDGASSTCPQSIKTGQPFFLEAGWLVEPHVRQRLIRHYDERGCWTHLTLVTEQKLSKTVGR